MTYGEQELEKFANTGDDSAFESVVEAYAGLVYGVALRRVNGDQGAAEEVAQNVFSILARKADGISARPGLVAWLHRTTTLEAANFRRAEANRRRKMDTYRQQIESAAENADRESLMPVIDEALDKLPESDRLAVLYHYFEGRDFREVGNLLGKSDAAAQKQTRRALEKLGDLLQKRGVAISAVALGSFLGAELGKAAPFGLAAALAKGSAAAAANAAPTKAILATATALLFATIVTVPLVPKGLRIANLKSEIAQLQEAAGNDQNSSQHPISALTVAPPGTRFEHRLAELRGVPAAITGETYVRSWIRANGGMPQTFTDGPDFGDVSEAMRKLSADELWGIVRDLDEVEASAELLTIMRRLIVGQDLGWKDPQRALEYALERKMPDDVLGNIIRRWNTKHPEAAQAWLAEQRAAGLPARTRLEGYDPENALVRDLIVQTARDDLPGALALARKEIGGTAAVGAVSGVVPALNAGNQHGTFLELSSSLTSPRDRHRLTIDYTEGLLKHCYREKDGATSRLDALFEEPAFPSGRRDQVLREAAARIPIARMDFAMTMAYAVSTPEQRAANLVWLADHYHDAQPAHHSMNWLAEGPELGATRTQAYTTLIRELAKVDAARAAKYLPKIDDKKQRRQLRAEIE